VARRTATPCWYGSTGTANRLEIQQPASKRALFANFVFQFFKLQQPWKMPLKEELILSWEETR
jgi:hypothetical protein